VPARQSKKCYSGEGNGHFRAQKSAISGETFAGASRGLFGHVTHCDTQTDTKIKKIEGEKTKYKIVKIGLTSTITYLWIPATPWYGYAVCGGVAKSPTIPKPVPVLPVLGTLQVSLYPLLIVLAGLK
jgi:hypothetical protein